MIGWMSELVVLVFAIIIPFVYFDVGRFRGFLLLTVFSMLVVIATFRDSVNLPDYQSYLGIYRNSLGISIRESFILVEPSFVLISKICNHLGVGYMGLFFFFSTLGVAIKFRIIQKYSEFFVLSLVVYVSNFFIIHELIQIRASIAVGIIFLGLNSLVRKNIVGFTFYILLATFFHYSSFVFLFLFLINYLRFSVSFFYLLLLFSYLSYFYALDVISLILYKLPEFVPIIKDAYVDTERAADSAINVLGVFILSRLIIATFFVYFRKTLAEKSAYADVFVKLYALGCCAYVYFARFPEIAVRISYSLFLSEVILIPMLVFLIKPRCAGKSLVIVYAILSLSFNILFTQYFSYKA